MDRFSLFYGKLYEPAIEAEEVRASESSSVKMTFRGKVSSSLKSLLQKIKAFLKGKEEVPAQEGFFSKKVKPAAIAADSSTSDIMGAVADAIARDRDSILAKAKAGTYIMMGNDTPPFIRNAAISMKEALWEESVWFFMFTITHPKHKPVTIGIVTNGGLGRDSKTLLAGVVDVEINPADFPVEANAMFSYMDDHGGKASIDVTLMLHPYFDASKPYTGKPLGSMVVLKTGRLELTDTSQK